jgi:hypothetical protein
VHGQQLLCSHVKSSAGFHKILEGPNKAEPSKMPTRLMHRTLGRIPSNGRFMVVAGHEFNEAHSFGRSQHFAYDIFGMGPHWEITRNGGATIADFCTWGRQVIAPTDGVVVYARNDVT